MKLTNEQAQIVEENHALIYWYANLKQLKLDDWYDLLAIELCKTVIKHHPEKSSLANYYKLRCDCLCNKEYQKTQAQKRFNLGVYDLEEVYNWTTPNDCKYEDVDDLQLIVDTFSSEYQEIIVLKYQGYTQGEIANMLGLSQSQISKILRKVRDEYGQQEET